MKSTLVNVVVALFLSALFIMLLGYGVKDMVDGWEAEYQLSVEADSVYNLSIERKIDSLYKENPMLINSKTFVFGKGNSIAEYKKASEAREEILLLTEKLR